MKKQHNKRRPLLTITAKRGLFGRKTGGQDVKQGLVSHDIKTMLESENPKIRMQGVDALDGRIPMLKEVLENCPSHADVAEAVASQLKVCPDMLMDMVPGLWGKYVTSNGHSPAYKAAAEVLASMVDELENLRYNFVAYSHISLISENALARRISVNKLKERKSLLHEIYMSSAFEDTRKQAKALMDEIKGK